MFKVRPITNTTVGRWIPLSKAPVEVRDTLALLLKHGQDPFVPAVWTSASGGLLWPWAAAQFINQKWDINNGPCWEFRKDSGDFSLPERNPLAPSSQVFPIAV